MVDLDVGQFVVACSVMPCDMGGEGSSTTVRQRETVDIFILMQKCNHHLRPCVFKFAFPTSFFMGNNSENLSYNNLSSWWISLIAEQYCSSPAEKYHWMPVQSKEAGHLNSTVLNSCKKQCAQSPMPSPEK